MTISSTPSPFQLDQWARRGVWALPVYALLLAVGTLTRQPDPATDFPGYARYVTTDVFLASHLVASIGGAAIGVLGAVSLGVLAARGRSPRAAIIGTAATVVGNVLFTAIFAAAAFAQPAIGRAYLAGQTQASIDINSDVYGPALFGTFAVGAPFFLAGAILLGRAAARTSPAFRVGGIGYAIFLPLFVVTGFTIAVLQPVMALGLTASTLILARRLGRPRSTTMVSAADAQVATANRNPV
jgi:hypothetical protein